MEIRTASVGRSQVLVRVVNLPEGSTIEWEGGLEVTDSGGVDPTARVYMRASSGRLRVLTPDGLEEFEMPPSEWQTANNDHGGRFVTGQ